MTTEIVCAIITVSGMIVSAIISLFISRYGAKKEIEKMQLTWKREDVVSSDDEFAAMADAVAKYQVHGGRSSQFPAIGKVGAVRSKESGDLGEKLDMLYDAVSNGDFYRIEQALTEVIECKRKAQR